MNEVHAAVVLERDHEPLGLARNLLLQRGLAVVATENSITVNGKTTTWKNIYVARHQDRERPSQHFLVVLVADRAVADAELVATLRYAAFVLLPVTVGLVALSGEAVSITFQRGASQAACGCWR